MSGKFLLTPKKLKMSKVLLLLICINPYKSTLVVFSIFCMFYLDSLVSRITLAFKIKKKENFESMFYILLGSRITFAF
jgi:hypothetical protein